MKGRILLAPAYLLHQAPWRDSSRILEFFTRDHGRVTVFARGVRRPTSSVRSVLQPFQRLLVSYSLRGDAGTLIGAEIGGALEGAVPSERIMSGFYLNELLLKLLIRHDSHPELYDSYAEALGGLRSEGPEARVLRLFEKRLLESVGYGLELTREADSGAALEAQAHYHYLPERGAVPAAAQSARTYSGAVLSALAAGTLDDGVTLRETRRLLREALNTCLEGKALKSRDVMLAMKRMSAVAAPFEARSAKEGQ